MGSWEFQEAYERFTKQRESYENSNGLVYYADIAVPNLQNIKDVMTRTTYVSNMSGRRNIIGLDLFDLVQKRDVGNDAVAMQQAFSELKSHAKAIGSHLIIVIQESDGKPGEANGSRQIRNLSQQAISISRKHLVTDSTPNGSMENIPARDYLGNKLADWKGAPRYIQHIGDELAGEAKIMLSKSNYSSNFSTTCQFEGAMGGMFSDMPRGRV